MYPNQTESPRDPSSIPRNETDQARLQGSVGNAKWRNNVKRSVHFSTLTIAVAILLSLATATLFSGCNEMGYADEERIVRVGEGQLTTMDKDGDNHATLAVAPDAEIVLDGKPAELDELDQGDAVTLATQKEADGTKTIRRIEAKSKESLQKDPPADQRGNEDVFPDQSPFVQDSTPDYKKVDGQHGRRTQPTQDESPARQDQLSTDTQDQVFQGNLAKIGDQQLTIWNEVDREVSFKLDDDTRFTIDGREATLDQLSVGFAVRITATQEEEMYLANRVEVTTDKSLDPEQGAPRPATPNDGPDKSLKSTTATETFRGTIASLSNRHFVIQQETGIVHTFRVKEETMITLNGKEATFDDLDVDQTVKVTAVMDGAIYVAESVDATREN